MTNIQSSANQLFKRVEHAYPGFKGYTDPRFIEEEINFKQLVTE